MVCAWALCLSLSREGLPHSPEGPAGGKRVCACHSPRESERDRREDRDRQRGERQKWQTHGAGSVAEPLQTLCEAC